MKTKLPKNQWLAIAAVLGIGLLLASAILFSKKALPDGDAQGHAGAAHAADDAAKPPKGPHGGRLFTAGDYAVEVTLFESGVEPQFRLYTMLGGQPLDPAQSAVQITLERLGQAPQRFQFKPQGDYLLGDAAVVEPHSFKATVSASHAGQQHRFSYEQIEARVTMTDEQLQQAGVALATAGPAKITTRIQLPGEVHYNGDRTVQIVPRLAGLVEAVSANAGDHVRKGEVLAVLSSQALAEQRGLLLTAQRRLALARSVYDREKILWEEKISPEQDLLQAHSAMQEMEIQVHSAQQRLMALGASSNASDANSGKLTRFEIRSPIDGIVTDKRISAGAAVKEDDVIFTVSDLSTVWVEAAVAAQDLGRIASGQRAQIKANAFDAQAEATISYVSTSIGEQTRAATARIVLPNPNGLWRPGLPVTVNVVADELEVPVAVAVEGVQTVRDWQAVFGRYGTSLEARPLELGRNDGRSVEVKAGLKAGEQYAAQNSYLIKADLEKSGASHDH
jgi:cobalt-zinc-cadmium efflux system membrane fusion protein